MWRVILALDAAMICAAIVISHVDPKAGHAFPPAVSYVTLMSLLAPLFLVRWRLTPKGAAAVDSWRRHGGVPISAAVPSSGSDAVAWLAPSATGAATGPGVAPLPRGQAWSSLGGRWHPVRIGPLLKRPWWSTTGVLGLLIFLTAVPTALAAGAGLMADTLYDPRGKPIAIAPLVLVPLAVGGIVILGLWLPAFLHRMNQPRSATFHGEVVKRWKKESSEDPDRYFVSVHDGTSSRTMTFQVSDVQHARVGVGDTVQVTDSPRWRRPEDIEVVPDP